MPEVELGHLKFGIDSDTDDYIAHLFVDGEFVTELCRVRRALFTTKEQYKEWMEFLSRCWMKTVEDNVTKGLEGKLSMVHSDLRKKNPGVN